ncbi:hypothetical protein [[Eubacterium] cellulosolvens]
MENSLLKIRIAMLWIFMAVASIIHYVLVSSSDLQYFQTEIEKGLGFATFGVVFLLVILVMAFLTVTLKDVANRRVNLVLGGIFTIINIAHIFGCPVARSSAHQIIIVLSTIVVSILIVWYAWKWPKD